MLAIDGGVTGVLVGAARSYHFLCSSRRNVPDFRMRDQRFPRSFPREDFADR